MAGRKSTGKKSAARPGTGGVSASAKKTASKKAASSKGSSPAKSAPTKKSMVKKSETSGVPKGVKKAKQAVKKAVSKARPVSPTATAKKGAAGRTGGAKVTSAAKKSAPKKASGPAKKAAAKKAAPKKAAVKKSTPKKSAGKTASKKAPVQKAAVSKSAGGRSSTAPAGTRKTAGTGSSIASRSGPSMNGRSANGRQVAAVPAKAKAVSGSGNNSGGAMDAASRGSAPQAARSAVAEKKGPAPGASPVKNVPRPLPPSEAANGDGSSHSASGPMPETESPGKAIKEKVQIEFAVRSTPHMLYELVSTPSGFAEWYCDDVNVKGDDYTFMWQGEEEATTMIGRKLGEVIRFHRHDDEDEHAYFEFRVRIDAMTNDVALIVTDHAWPDEVDETKNLWNSQIANLLRVLGA